MLQVSSISLTRYTQAIHLNLLSRHKRDMIRFFLLFRFQFFVSHLTVLKVFKLEKVRNLIFSHLLIWFTSGFCLFVVLATCDDVVRKFEWKWWSDFYCSEDNRLLRIFQAYSHYLKRKNLLRLTSDVFSRRKLLEIWNFHLAHQLNQKHM